jgi:hypothetical protein
MSPTHGGPPKLQNEARAYSNDQIPARGRAVGERCGITSSSGLQGVATLIASSRCSRVSEAPDVTARIYLDAMEKILPVAVRHRFAGRRMPVNLRVTTPENKSSPGRVPSLPCATVRRVVRFPYSISRDRPNFNSMKPVNDLGPLFGAPRRSPAFMFLERKAGVLRQCRALVVSSGWEPTKDLTANTFSLDSQ